MASIPSGGAVARTESGFDPEARSHARRRGSYATSAQDGWKGLRGPTAERADHPALTNPQDSLEAGACYSWPTCRNSLAAQLPALRCYMRAPPRAALGGEGRWGDAFGRRLTSPSPRRGSSVRRVEPTGPLSQAHPASSPARGVGVADFASAPITSSRGSARAAGRAKLAEGPCVAEPFQTLPGR